jgi:hypothetical protein
VPSDHVPRTLAAKGATSFTHVYANLFWPRRHSHTLASAADEIPVSTPLRESDHIWDRLAQFSAKPQHYTAHSLLK